MSPEAKVRLRNNPLHPPPNPLPLPHLVLKILCTVIPPSPDEKGIGLKNIFIAQFFKTSLLIENETANFNSRSA